MKEDLLLLQSGISWIAVEKIIAGMVQALMAGLVVIPAASFVCELGHPTSTFAHP